MDERELLKAFKKANWDREEAEIFGFMAEEAELSSKCLVQMLEVLCARKFSADMRSHAQRCAIYSNLIRAVEDKALFLPFLNGLKHGDIGVRMLLVQALPKVNNYADHPKLCALLRSKDADLRKNAADVLKKVGGRTALNLLNNMVLEPHFLGRLEVIDVVLPIAGHYALTTLEAVTSIGTVDEKIKALKFLGNAHFMQKNIREALRVIHAAMNEPKENEAVVRQAIVSFCNHCNEDGYFEHIAYWLESPRAPLVVSAVSGLRRFNSPRVMAAFERRLRAGPNLVRMEVLNVLESIGTENVLPPLVDALGHRSLVVRQRASEIMAEFSRRGKVDIAQIVIWLLRSKDATARHIATDLVQTLKDPHDKVWPRLLTFLRDEDWWVRERVMDALVVMVGKKLTPHLLVYLNDDYDVIRRFAIDALIRLEDTKCLPGLIRAAESDPDWWTREKAIEGIAKIGGKRLVPFIIKLSIDSEETQLACISAMKTMNATEGLDRVVGLLQSHDRDVRMESLRLLDHWQARQCERAVRRLLDDPDIEVSRQAKQILTHWKIQISVGESGTILSALDAMLVKISIEGADDLLIAPDSAPFMKKMDKIVRLTDTVLTAEQVHAILTPILTLSQLEALEKRNDLDFSYELRSEALRFRANLFHQRGGIGGVFRIIKGEIPRIETLGLPKIALTFSEFSYGLVLFGGPTGSGKSTTLSAIVDDINRNQARHIISLEDPIEVVHQSLRGLVNQREIGVHTRSFQTALRSTLREDPDVILIGEMRDLDTIRFAITAADTGHLVFGTVHTVSADTTVDRLLNAFPPEEQSQMRSSLANNLRAVVCQHLLKRKDGTGRVLACEVMINSDAVANLIRKGQTYQIPSVIATSYDVGMRLMDNELLRLQREGIISAELAYMKANVKKNFADLISEDDAIPVDEDLLAMGDSVESDPSEIFELSTDDMAADVDYLH